MSDRLRFVYRAYRYRFRDDPAEIRFVRQSLRPGQVAVDLGCHKGAYTYWMRRRVGASGTVYAFEPQPQQIAYLRKAFAAMRYDNVMLVPLAVSNTRGKMPLRIPIGSTHFASLEARRPTIVLRAEKGEARTEMVDVTTLDDFFSTEARKTGAGGSHTADLHFLKIDVEGHEFSVLEGAKRTLEAHHPKILLECESRHRPDGDVRPVFAFLESLGYTGTFFSTGKRRPLSEFDPPVHQSFDPTSYWLPKSYVSNFAFEFAT